MRNEQSEQLKALQQELQSKPEQVKDLNRAMASIWKKRGKQIEKVLLNTSDMYSSIRGIAGVAVPAVKLLEFPGGDEE